MKEFPLLSMFNIHENLLESLLELQNYADVQAVLAKYDGKPETPPPQADSRRGVSAGGDHVECFPTCRWLSRLSSVVRSSLKRVHVCVCVLHRYKFT